MIDVLLIPHIGDWKTMGNTVLGVDSFLAVEIDTTTPSVHLSTSVIMSPGSVPVDGGHGTQPGHAGGGGKTSAKLTTGKMFTSKKPGQKL